METALGEMALSLMVMVSGNSHIAPLNLGYLIISNFASPGRRFLRQALPFQTMDMRSKKLSGGYDIASGYIKTYRANRFLRRSPNSRPWLRETSGNRLQPNRKLLQLQQYSICRTTAGESSLRSSPKASNEPNWRGDW
jgi:hypothetical protein